MSLDTASNTELQDFSDFESLSPESAFAMSSAASAPDTQAVSLMHSVGDRTSSLRQSRKFFFHENMIVVQVYFYLDSRYLLACSVITG